jgi:hypothetical protein
MLFKIYWGQPCNGFLCCFRTLLCVFNVLIQRSSLGPTLLLLYLEIRAPLLPSRLGYCSPTTSIKGTLQHLP